MKQNINKLLIAGLLALTGIPSCVDKLDVTDQNKPTTESYFKNSTGTTEWCKCYLLYFAFG
jgi:hypothetical protein